MLSQDLLLNEVSESAKCHWAHAPMVCRRSAAGFGGCVWLRQPIPSSFYPCNPHRPGSAAAILCGRIFTTQFVAADERCRVSLPKYFCLIPGRNCDAGRFFRG